ncbi:MAG: hypothetical protein J5881_00655 [Clostridia bacterium]|nr:hypothetical protein [Clostridia bacterium]
MKVLFAVSNEEISETIVKRYQKQYKEIISYKNVYYFNAILKEIQKDKTYDRIVISEELEAFTNTQYEQIDRFIFDKLDSISDEAANTRGDNTPIILICSDRRTKGEEMLVKLFGIGIYDALIGNDRGVDEVCNLIHKSRSKKEAKLYYKIEADEVKYQSENENDVSEQEIQNILAHYKRLGKNEDKYVTSFDNIVAQYNDAQLRIISKFLPLNVRAVLEEKSPKYQQIMSFNNAVTDSIRKPKKPQSLGPSGKLLRPKNKAVMPTEPIVIPNAVDTENVKKLTRNRANKVDDGIQGIEETLSGFDNNSNNDFNAFEQDDSKQVQNSYNPFESNNNQTAYDPFAQDNNQNQDAFDPFAQSNTQFENFTSFNSDITNSFQNEIPEEPKRRGRKPKNVEEEEEPVQPQAPKRRGRPRKNPVVEPQDDGILPGFEASYSNHQEEENDDDTILPGFEEIDDNVLPGFEENNSNDNILPGVEEDNSEDNALPGFEDYNINNSEPQSFDDNEQFNNNQFDNYQFENNPFENNQFDNNQFENNPFENNQFDNNQFGNNQFGNAQFSSNQFDNSQ